MKYDYTINLKSIWGKGTTTEIATAIISELNGLDLSFRSDWIIAGKVQIVLDLEDLITFIGDGSIGNDEAVIEFDSIMDDLYNWADTRVPGGRLCWVSTLI